MSLCTQRGYHRTDSYQWAHLPVTLTVRCKDCDERLWHNDPPTDGDSTPSRDDTREPAKQPDSGSSSGGAADG